MRNRTATELIELPFGRVKVCLFKPQPEILNYNVVWYAGAAVLCHHVNFKLKCVFNNELSVYFKPIARSKYPIYATTQL